MGYYEALAELRARLLIAGEEGWALNLLSAERSATTSGEVISNVGVLLEKLLKSDVPDRLGLRSQVFAVLKQGEEAWKRSNE